MKVADASTTCIDVHSDRNGTKTTAKTMEVNKAPMMPKPPNSLVACWHKYSAHRRYGWADHAHGCAER